MPKALDISNQKFGKLTAIKVVDYKANRRYWECVCECGNTSIVCTNKLKSGYTKSCGCDKFKGFKINLEERKKIAEKERPVNKIYTQYKNAAKNRGLDFNLTKEDFKNLIFQNCNYCGVAPSNELSKKDRPIVYQGIDRLDSKLGYFKENCVPCCKTCNLAKNNIEYEEFMNWLKRIAIKHQDVKFTNAKDYIKATHPELYNHWDIIPDEG